MCVQFMKSPLANARTKVEHIYTGPVDTELAEAMFECDPDVSITVDLIYNKHTVPLKKNWAMEKCQGMYS